MEGALLDGDLVLDEDLEIAFFILEYRKERGNLESNSKSYSRKVLYLF